MEYPRNMDSSIQGIVIALSLRFAKRKPGLEQDDLINEALVVYERIIQLYDPRKKTKLNTVVYRSIKNQFINMQNKYLTPPHQELKEERVEPIEGLENILKEGLLYIQEHLSDPATVEVLDQLTSTTSRKTTIKEICHELGISFFKYQQCEFRIKQLIKKMEKDR